MRTLGIIGAMNLEVDLLIKEMKDLSEEHVAGMTFYRGTIESQNVVVVCCGVGKVNAASCTQAMISEYHVDGIINTGIAGGLHESINICDVVISSDVAHHDVRQEQMLSCYPHQAFFKADARLIKLVRQAASINGRVHIGRIVSGEMFVSNETLRKQIKTAFDPYCVEMEGAAIGHVAYLNCVPFVVIRSISDHADSDATMSYETFEVFSANQSAQIVLETIKLMNQSSSL